VSQVQEILILKGSVILCFISLMTSVAHLFTRPAPPTAVYFVDAPQAFLREIE
jgi:hypothetical protein